MNQGSLGMDDDELITRDWVMENFRVLPGRGAIINHALSLFQNSKGWFIVAGPNGGDDSKDSFCILIVHTRGDVRRFCEAVASPIGSIKP